MDSNQGQKPAYYLSSSVNGEIYEFVVSGKFTMDSVEFLRKEVQDRAKSLKAKKLLCDLRGVELDFGYSQTYFIASTVPSFYQNIHTAFVGNSEHNHLHSFHEYFTKMSGISMKWFVDPEEARKWLMGGDK